MTLFENSVGLGTFKIGMSSVNVMYHVYHIVEYLDKEPIDYYQTAWEVGAIV